MAYTDQEMSGNRIAAIVIVVLIHLGLGYALISGLAYSAVKKAVERVTTVEVTEEEPPEEEEPPPPEEVPETVAPPPFVPPARLDIPTDRVQRQTPDKIVKQDFVDRQPATKQCPDGTTVLATAACGPATKTCPDGKVIRANATCPEPVAEKPKFTPKDPTPRNSQGSWVTTNDYPRRALREGAEGVTRVSLSVSADGRVSSCRVSGSSGNSELDDATCKNIERRARFRPATNGEGNEVAGNFSMSVRWQMPE